MESKSFEKFKDIKIDDIKIYFNGKGLTFLKKLKIETLCDLFENFERPDFEKSIPFSEHCLYEYLIVSVKLLKCKYLNCDPHVDINSVDGNKMYNFYFHDLGLSTKTCNLLYDDKVFACPKHFFEVVKNGLLRETVSRVFGLGQLAYNELLAKANVILGYYESPKKDVIIENSDDNVMPVDEDSTLELLYKELQSLRDASKKIDAQIDVVLAKIQDKTFGQSRGGILK